MELNRDNYEIWAIDYLEGILSTEQSASFMLFLAENPDLSEELDSIRDLSLAEPIVTDKMDLSILKKDFSNSHIHKDNFEEYCIAYYEGELDNSSTEELLAYAQSSNANNHTFKAYSQVFIEADTNVVFNNKRSLKKGPFIIPLNNRKVVKLGLSIAASLVLLVSFTALLRQYSTPQSMLPNASQKNTETAAQMPETITNTEEIPVNASSAVSTKTVAIVVHPPAINTSPQAFDTTDRPDVFIPAGYIDVVQLQGPENENSIIVSSNLRDYHINTNTKAENFIEAVQISSYNTYATVKHLNFDKVMRKSVDGINQMAETDLQYNSDTDDEGRLLAFAVSTDRFNVRKKFRN